MKSNSRRSRRSRPKYIERVSKGDNFVRAVRVALEAVADPAKALSMARYMKDRFPFLGVPQPIFAAALKSPFRSNQFTQAELLEVAAQLWAQDEREFHYAAVGLLSRHIGKLTPAVFPQLERFVLEHSWWDTVDALSSRVYGLLVTSHPQARVQMDLYATHANFWLRRVAILHQLGYRERTDEGRLWRYCLESAQEPEFFLRKAIGWALREYAKTQPDAVLEFVEAHMGVLSSLSVREALKHLRPAASRASTNSRVKGVEQV